MTTQPRKGFVRVEPHKAERIEAGPTLTQLENVADVLGFPRLPEGMRPPYYEESLRNLHALVQRTVNGDEAAARILATLKAAFAPAVSVRPEGEQT